MEYVKILQEDTRHMKIYFGKHSGPIEFGNILVWRVEVTRQILLNLSN